LVGRHQLTNAALAVAIARHAAATLGRPLADGAVLQGLAEVRWPGRLERIGEVIFDCAHNVEGTQALVAALPDSPRRVLVTSIVRDKNAAGMLAVLAPHFDRIVATRSPSERALEPDRLAELVSRTRGQGGLAGRQVECVESAGEALLAARACAGEVEGGLVVVAGSIFLVGALRAALLDGRLDAGRLAMDASDPLP
jgi:dihydrofolate synthase/folylpolyglutamate synthase